MRILLPFLLFAAGCTGAETVDPDENPVEPIDDTADEPEDDTNSGACGDTLLHTLEIIGSVAYPDDSPIAGAEVRLEERNYSIPAPGIWGAKTVTDANGDFSFTAVDIIDVEDCWGTLLDYVIVVEFENETFDFSRGVNSTLRSAVNFGGPADFTDPPLVPGK